MYDVIKHSGPMTVEPLVPTILEILEVVEPKQLV